MAVDAGIYSQLQQPQAFNPLAELAQYHQLQSFQNQNKLAQLGFADRERAQADLAGQRSIYASGAQGADLENALLKGGYADQALKFGADRRANSKLDAETSSKQVETKAKAFEQYKAMLETVQDPQQAEQFVSASYHDPIVGPELRKFGSLEDAVARIRQAATSPQAFAQWKAGVSIGMQKLAQMAQTQNVNLGGTMQTQMVQPATGQVTPLASNPITQSADNLASNQQSNANSLRSTSASMANAGALRDQAQATRDAASISARANSETDLRKEFAGLPEVKKYKEAIPAYSAVVKASKVNNPQADINLIYGLAKLYDPESVVREGEYDTIARSQAIPEWLKGQAQRLVGGGRLTEATKAQIREQAKIRLDSYKSEVDGARGSYEQVARGRGFNPDNIFPKIGGQLDTGNTPAAGALSADEQAELEQLRKRLMR